ncbi:MAG TPA: S41 family peptidase [Pyrinomonadaceae bacterium]|jgi:carboxyl-terminal processing protease|nr:S41 family peptidase [Pyrinomonadaceae bacterium]
MSKLHPLRLAALAVLLSHLVAFDLPVAAQVVGASSPVVGKVDEATARREEAFEIVWQAVRDYHFDPHFGGVDWDAVRAEFAPRVAGARSDREAHFLLQQMLNRLGKSHFAVVPPESIPALPEDDGPDAEGLADEGGKARAKPSQQGLDLTERLTHGVAIDLRIINRAAIVTRVEPGSNAERAGLRAGVVIRGVDGVPMSRVLREMDQAAAFQPALRHEQPAEILFEHFNGPAGTEVRISYLDARNVLRRAVVRREKLKGEMSPPLQSFPPQFVEFESKRLRGGVGYIRFNVFAIPVIDKFCAALRGMADAPGLVVDLRGNRGGVMGMIYGMGGLLADRDSIFGEMRTRQGGTIFRITPQRHHFKGAIAVLVDATTVSAGEMLASGLQESGRAVIVGERSAGSTLPSVAKELPTGAILQYAVADFVSAYGRVLEGQGVKPDIAARLDRRSLLSGRDPQLEAALAVVAGGGGASITYKPVELPGDAQGDGGGAVEVTKKGAANEGAEAAVDPQVGRIVENYLQAVGGRAALEKISSRVSKGVFEGSDSGVPTYGAVEITEKFPDKSVTVVHLPNVGALRRAYTGAYGYEQMSLFGFREMRGAELEELRREADFRWQTRLLANYPEMIFKGTEQVGGAEAYVVEATPARGLPTTLYFDASTGLLLRRDSVYYEDYREVDGVKLPFVTRTGTATIRLREVKHNVAVDDAAFAETKDCFTR